MRVFPGLGMVTWVLRKPERVDKFFFFILEWQG